MRAPSRPASPNAPKGVPDSESLLRFSAQNAPRAGGIAADRESTVPRAARFACYGSSYEHAGRTKGNGVSWHQLSQHFLSARISGSLSTLRHRRVVGPRRVYSASLLIGTILSTVGDLSGLAFFNQNRHVRQNGGQVGNGTIAIGYALRTPPLVLFSLAAVGFAADAGGAGGPLAVLVIAVVASELGKTVSKETKVDIIVTPAVTILGGCGLALVAAPWISALASSVGGFIMLKLPSCSRFFIGVIVSVVIGIALTLPISSAAICAALGLTGLAGGAAGGVLRAQMVGFAVLGFRENRWGGLLSQGLGTSMQMGNIVKKAADLGAGHRRLGRHRAGGHVRVPTEPERTRRGIGHGNVRARGHRRVHRLDIGHGGRGGRARRSTGSASRWSASFCRRLSPGNRGRVFMRKGRPHRRGSAAGSKTPARSAGACAAAHAGAPPSQPLLRGGSPSPTTAARRCP